MPETLNPIETSTGAHEVMEAKLGHDGMQMLDEQLAVWHGLNEQELHSPLRETLKSGDTTLPKGTLLHSTGQFDANRLSGIAEMGIVSGELIGIFEDSETHGCADFFRVSNDTTVADYIEDAKRPIVKESGLTLPKGERMLARGITFIIDPKTEGVADLLKHDGYRDPDMQSFISPPGKRTEADTAAILVGVPRGAIAGILAGSKLLEDPQTMQQLAKIFPDVPMIDHQGVLHT